MGWFALLDCYQKSSFLRRINLGWGVIFLVNALGKHYASTPVPQMLRPNDP
jgi:hypothetical protein